MCELKIADASVLCPDMTVAQHQTIEISEGKISAIHDYSPQDSAADRGCILDGRGKLVMPGLADCHMHTGPAAFKRQSFRMNCR